ncbi:VF530 family protein [Myroides pelagicus]|uniref:DNA-binding protein VF530 n=1 Tax=Myroides pelagicus TaxID=270914 RepID=A0A7K1GPD6_9FLAO|nr:VF530 family protein [Myroides pelagicus]MEC4114779.1 VF530 family protein [Myroides pelagicus]MTH30610.1 DNA-binding protein VF530 [Myroides pelagicus]
MHTSKDPLHGKKLVDILEELVDYYNGFEALGNQISIRCFTHDPSINSSLKFLRKTPWARDKVESLYLYVLRQKAKQQRSER